MGIATALIGGCRFPETFFPSIRAGFRDLSYPVQNTAPPERNEPRTLLSTLGPTLVVGYARPHFAGRCYELLSHEREFTRDLWSFGHCAGTSSTDATLRDESPEERFDRCIRAGILPGAPTLSTPPAPPAPRPRRGRTRAAPTPPPAASVTVVAKALPAGCELDSGDRALFTLALAETAEALWSTARARGITENSALPDELAAPVREVFRATARTLAPGNGNPPSEPFAFPTPALALSGGAANGAFQAGYVFALLSAREWLREIASRQDPAQATPYDTMHFHTVASTSVGSLVAILVDLAESETPTRGVAREALDACVAEGRRTRASLPAGELGARDHEQLVARTRDALSVPELPSDRSAQECALHRLVRYFTTTQEWTLLCAADGDLTQLVNANDSRRRAYALRFDPLERGIVTPWFDRFGDALTQNRLTRVAFAVDVEQNLLAGLDERVCVDLARRGLAPASRECLTSGVMASIVEPIFADSVPMVWTGLSDSGDRGTWLDGGLRSGNPVLRAVLSARVRPPGSARGGQLEGRVLAINTHRVEGIPSSVPATAPDLLFNFIGGFVEQTRQWELAYATALERARARRYAAIERLYHPGVTAALPVAVPPAPGGNVYSVFVPDDIKPTPLSATGYVFDPVVMTGLFLWGQRAFLRDAASVTRFLEWDALRLDAEQSDGALAARGATNDQALDLFRRAYPSPAPGRDDAGTWWARHRRERFELMERHMPLCSTGGSQ